MSQGYPTRITVTIDGAPRTKKTSNRVVKIGKGPKAFTKVLPSAAHEKWFKDASKQISFARAEIIRMGYDLPIVTPVHVRATVYRETSVGDWTGYIQAIGDLIGWKHKGTCMGLIEDDRLIAHWDGSRLSKDSANPRIEIEINVLPVEQADLFEAVPEEMARA